MEQLTTALFMYICFIYVLSLFYLLFGLLSLSGSLYDCYVYEDDSEANIRDIKNYTRVILLSMVAPIAPIIMVITGTYVAIKHKK